MWVRSILTRVAQLGASWRGVLRRCEALLSSGPQSSFLIPQSSVLKNVKHEEDEETEMSGGKSYLVIKLIWK